MLNASGSWAKSFILDQDGRHWSISGNQLQQHLRTSLAGEALVQFAIVNLGWVGVRFDAARVHVRCRPQFMTSTTLGSLFYFIFDNRHKALALSVLGENWQHYVHTKVDSVLTLIESMQMATPSSRLTLLSRRVAPKNSMLGSGIGVAVGISRRSSSIDELAHHMNILFSNQRWTISCIDQVTGEVTIERKGTGFTPFNPHWTASCVDKGLIGYAGPEYANWIAKTRRYVLDRNELVCDDVDATIPFPGIGFTRLTYSRATAPTALADGRRVALSAAISDASINLKKSA